MQFLGSVDSVFYCRASGLFLGVRGITESIQPTKHTKNLNEKFRAYDSTRMSMFSIFYDFFNRLYN